MSWIRAHVNGSYDLVWAIGSAWYGQCRLQQCWRSTMHSNNVIDDLMYGPWHLVHMVWYEQRRLQLSRRSMPKVPTWWRASVGWPERASRAAAVRADGGHALPAHAERFK